jgi:hypothetical protein
VVVVLKGSKVADMAAVATVGVERKDDHLTLAMMGASDSWLEKL